ncbi:hypothetical protein AAFF_G00023580 [Aldrovandia affinis]|uniref:Ubiquitin-associated protein 1 n=1 Tax=Aldrovandia affinis TaxID=143900 RepID=A0AAD7T5R6_9TELE|nr:hypothetical protein AAFF_G00023580 [Aldrovandia affinis]
MAGWKSGSDFQNSGLCYLDQVPFKINDKFRSPARVGLPVGFCLPDCTSVLAEFEYDFSLERRVVRWGKELEEARAAQERVRLEAESKSEMRQVPSWEQEAESGNRMRPCSSDSEGPAQPPPALNPPPQGIDLADFESEEDPFDKLERKTLDDKEELRSILLQAVTPLLLPKTGLYHEPNGLATLPARDGGTGGQLETGRPCNIRSLTFPKLSDSTPDCAPMSGPAPQCSLPNQAPPLMQPAFPQSDVIALTQPVIPQNDVIAHQAHGMVLKKVRGRALRAVTSTLRFQQLGSKPKARSHTSLNSLPSCWPPPACVVVPPPCGWPGQRWSQLGLSPRERECVETIMSMGYPYEGVLRAMQRQGQDMKQVLDYLLLHTRLCERGFDASAVDECLEMYQCSEKKALEFLQLVSHFGEMGFERDAIKEVLRVHNNDQGKALDELMTRAATS